MNSAKLVATYSKSLFQNVKEICLNILTTNKNVSISFIINIVYIMILKYLKIDSYLLIGLNIMANTLASIETKKQIIFIDYEN